MSEHTQDASKGESWPDSGSLAVGDLIGAYLDGELEPAERERVERAVESDPALANELARLRRMDEAYAPGDVQEPSDADWARASAALRARTVDRQGDSPHRGPGGPAQSEPDRHSGHTARRTRPRARWVLALAAAAAVVAAALVYGSLSPDRQLQLPGQIVDGAPWFEAEPGRGFRAVERKVDGRRALRVDFVPESMTGE